MGFQEFFFFFEGGGFEFVPTEDALFFRKSSPRWSIFGSRRLDFSRFCIVCFWGGRVRICARLLSLGAGWILLAAQLELVFPIGSLALLGLISLLAGSGWAWPWLIEFRFEEVWFIFFGPRWSNIGSRRLDFFKFFTFLCFLLWGQARIWLLNRVLAGFRLLLSPGSFSDWFLGPARPDFLVGWLWLGLALADRISVRGGVIHIFWPTLIKYWFQEAWFLQNFYIFVFFVAGAGSNLVIESLPPFAWNTEDATCLPTSTFRIAYEHLSTHALFSSPEPTLLETLHIFWNVLCGYYISLVFEGFEI